MSQLHDMLSKPKCEVCGTMPRAPGFTICESCYQDIFVNRDSIKSQARKLIQEHAHG